MGPVDTTEVLLGVFYVVHPHHRDPQRQDDKSQWTISPAEELTAFRTTITQRWFVGTLGWGLHVPDGTAEYLGTASGTALPLRRLFIAKFVEATPPTWHGYPSDHQRHPSNVPPAKLLKSWVDAGFLRLATMAKVLRGKPCNL